MGTIYRCEDLTSNSQMLGDFVKEITCGTVSPTDEWLNSAIQIRKVNVHAGRRSQLDLNNWQIEVIQKVVDPVAWEIYESLGYPRPGFLKG